MDAILPIRLIDVIDMAIVATFFWAGIVWLRRTRARMALLGLAILGGIYLLARQFGLQLTAWLLQGFFAVFVIILVVVFQEDLRQFFEQIAVWGLRRRPPAAPPDVVDTVVRAVSRLARSRTGALLVFPGRDPLDRHIEGGIALDARVSEPLLLSLFDPHSPGHDGAVIVEGERISRFAVHLPLSTDHKQLGNRGTRHAAALGLAERTDALCVVVSEERGTISVAHNGRLIEVEQPQLLSRRLRRFLAEAAPEPKEPASLWQRLGERWLATLFAAGLAFGVWLVFVPGSTLTEVTRKVPVEVENLPPGFELETVDPAEVEVTLSGRWRDLYLVNPANLKVRIDALLVQLGRRTFQLSPSQVEHPPRLEVVAVRPAQVRLSVKRQSAAEKSSARAAKRGGS